jgi:hypothetical protein
VYHYAPYEPSAFKRLMGRYSTREQELAKLIRAGRFIDLYGVVRQGVRAGIERYSIKNLEVLYGFNRAVPLAKGVKRIKPRSARDDVKRVRHLCPPVAIHSTMASSSAGEVHGCLACVSSLGQMGWSPSVESRKAS